MQPDEGRFRKLYSLPELPQPLGELLVLCVVDMKSVRRLGGPDPNVRIADFTQSPGPQSLPPDVDVKLRPWPSQVEALAQSSFVLRVFVMDGVIGAQAQASKLDPVLLQHAHWRGRLYLISSVG
jgi:hypothetical protein